MGGKLIVVAGAQFGSEGKGAVTDQLSRPEYNGHGRVVGVRVAGPNAGHIVLGRCPKDCAHGDDADVTVKGTNWHRWKLRTIPVPAVSNEDADLVIAAGSEIDESVLNEEIEQLESAGYQITNRLDVDSQATILTGEHKFREASSDLVQRLGSTAKGIGAARSERIWRQAETFGERDGGTHDTTGLLYRFLNEGATVIIEGTQGYGLGLHTKFYPQVTSSDCRAIDFLSMAGLSPWHPSVEEFQVWLACRVRPIRVAGNSGPLKGETSWDALGLPAERTTVTNKVRRVGSWDATLVREAVQANGGSTVNLALTMVDTVIPGLTEASHFISGHISANTRMDLDHLVETVELGAGAKVAYVGTSPRTGIFI